MDQITVLQNLLVELALGGEETAGFSVGVIVDFLKESALNLRYEAEVIEALYPESIEEPTSIVVKHKELTPLIESLEAKKGNKSLTGDRVPYIHYKKARDVLFPTDYVFYGDALFNNSTILLACRIWYILNLPLIPKVFELRYREALQLKTQTLANIAIGSYPVDNLGNS